MSYAIRGEKYRMHNNILSTCFRGKVLELYRDRERERDDHNAAADHHDSAGYYGVYVRLSEQFGTCSMFDLRGPPPPPLQKPARFGA